MEKGNKNLKLDKRKPPIFILLLLVFMAIVLYFIYIIELRFEPVSVIAYKGSAVTGKELVENLLRTDLNGSKFISPLQVEEDSIIYKKFATYYIGQDKKTNINLDYPIYINNNGTLLLMSDESKLITSNFEIVDGYKNSAITDGILYNLSNFERADSNNYLFIKNSDNLFINTKKIIIKSVANRYEIPKNSIINFKEKYITYYHLEDERFKYETIIDIDTDSKIIVDLAKNENSNDNGLNNKEEELMYKNFLINLNLLKEKKDIKEKNIEEIDTNKNPEEPSKVIERIIEIVEMEDNVEKISQVSQENNNSENSKFVWVKPEVSTANFETSVYTASTKISIYDPAGVIKNAINFEIYKDGKVYMRSQAISSGNFRIGVLEPNTEYEIRGTYRYTTEDKKIIEVQFINQKITTKDASILKPISLSFDNEKIYTNKIEISNVRLTSNIQETSETIVGIKKGEILINGNVNEIKSSDLRKILNGQSIVLQSGENLSSNSNYEYEIRFYDVSNNLVKLENSRGNTRTCMQKPEVLLKRISNKKDRNIIFNVNFNNPDNVEIKNKKYIVYSVSDEIVDQGEILNDRIELNEKLEFAKYYTLCIYADYNLNDNKPDVINDLLISQSIATASLDDYGNLYMDLSINSENITQNSAELSLNINSTSKKTDTELIGMIKSVKVVVSENNGNMSFEKDLNSEEINLLKQLGVLNLSFIELNSNTGYNVKIDSIIEAGNTRKTLSVIINGPKRFTTLKEEAIVNIKNLFVLNDTIDFDINIYDKDNASKSEIATLEVIASNDEIMLRKEILVSNNPDNIERITVTNLEENSKYYLSLIIDRYSVKPDDLNGKEKVFEFKGDEQRITPAVRRNKSVGVIYTNDVGGNILLKNITKGSVDTSGNLIDLNSEVNWYSECFNTNRGYFKRYDKENKIFTIGVGNNTSQMYIFDLLSSYKEYDGEELSVYFKYKKSNSNLKIYLQNGKDFTANRLFEITSEYSEEDEDDWFIFNSNNIDNEIFSPRYIGLQLVGEKDSYVELKNFKVTLKSSFFDDDSENQDEIENNDDTEEIGDTEENETEENIGIDNETEKYKIKSNFILNLNLYSEKLEEIGYNANITNGIYYVRINNISDNEIFDKEFNEYEVEAKNDNGSNKNAIENFLKVHSLEENKNYKISLFLRNPNLPDREYILNTIEVNTKNSEIKNISTIDEYLEIQPNGNYIFSKNLNLDAGDYTFGNEGLVFNGSLDFNGKTITRTIKYKENDENYKHYLFYEFSENAIIQNLYFDIGIDIHGEDGRTNIAISYQNSGLVYKNIGLIKNIIVNLRSCTQSPIKEFAIIGYENNGTLDNFIIYLRSNFYLAGEGALGFVSCNGGTIKNGYITPYPNRNYSIKPIECSEHIEINIACLASHVKQTTINNIYSLVTINNQDENNGISEDAKFYAGNILAETINSTVQNVYSVGLGNITAKNSINQTIGPTISYPFNSEDNNIVKNSYFFIESGKINFNDDFINDIYRDGIKNNEYNVNMSIAALSNQEFQSNILNSEDSDKKFIINSTIKQYFPKIILPDVMPKQINIPMKKTEETDAEILFVEPIEDGDTEKLVEITLFNPQEAIIDKIELQDLEVDKYRVHSDLYCKDSTFEKCKGHDAEGYCLDAEGNRILVEEDGYTQNYLSGQTTKLITKIKIPSEVTLDSYGFDNRRYGSKYYVKTIKAKGRNEKIFIDDEGNQLIFSEIKLKYFYQVSDINGWKRINEYPNENYRVISDLNFANNSYNDYCIKNIFTGILDGKYANESGEKIATIHNIGLEGTETRLPLFYKIDNSTVSNLKIDGFTQLLDEKNITLNMYIGGLIGVTTKGTILDNIHIKNAKITTKAPKNNGDTFYIGGLISNSTETIIRNCSVSFNENKDSYNISDIDEQYLSTVSIGGLVGYGQEGTINNCFVRNIYIKINARTSEGIGGIIGSLKGGEIYSSYSTGQIRTNTTKIGGTFGEGKYYEKYEKVVPNICKYCYSTVNIKTDNIDLGGIGGNLDARSIETTIDNISLGNLYTSVAGNNIRLNRVVGTLATSEYDNYAYRDQLINGFKVTENDSNFNRGAKYVVNKEEIVENFNNMFKKEYYLLEDLVEENIPRLKYKDSNELLPNQEQLQKLPENPTLEILSAVEEDGFIKLKIKDENKVPVRTNSIQIGIANFDYTEVDLNKSFFDNNNKIHTLFVRGNPLYYLDSYEINKIKYEGQDEWAELAVKVSYTAYKQIRNAQEWAAEFCPNYSGYNYHKDGTNDGKLEFLKYQNYELAGDINLNDIKNLNNENLSIPVNLEIGRLKGVDGIKPKIYNAELTSFRSANSGLFLTIERELKNIYFYNITIKNTSGSYTGIIAKCSAQEISNVDFSNINITGNGYTGCIGYSTCTVINDINLENIECSGTSYLGAFMGYSYPGIIKRIKGKDITIHGKGSQIGGLIGYIYNTTAYTSDMSDLYASNVYVEDKTNGNYVGGIIGMNYCRNTKKLYINNVTINCSANTVNTVGGAIGYNWSGVQSVYVYGANIKSNGTYYIGGIAGHGSSVIDGYIEGYSENGKIYNIIEAPRAARVGAIIGYTWSTLERTFAKNMNVKGNTDVGGLLGWSKTCNVRNSVAQDCNITGNKNVGGIMGTATSDSYSRTTMVNMYNTYNNSNVIANSANAGGIIGYLNNTRMTNNLYVSKFFRNFVACGDIYSPSYAGSFIGFIEKPVYYINNTNKYYYANLLVTNIDEKYPIGNINSLSETYKAIHTTIDSNTGEEVTVEELVTRTIPPEETIEHLFNTIFYKYTVENGIKVLEKSKLDTLKNDKMYRTTLGFGNNNSNFIYNNLDTKFPIVRTLANQTITFLDGTIKQFVQTGIDLPGEATKNRMNSSSPKMMMSVKRNIVEPLPENIIYVSDVDKINIDFSKTSENSFFIYEMPDGNMSEKINIKERTYTFEYDFNSNIKFIIGNSSNEIEINIVPSEIYKRVGILDGNYYYLDGSNLVENGVKNSSYEFVNLYNGKALTTDGYIYDIENHIKLNNKITGLRLLNDVNPIFSFINSNNKVETFYHYSKITDEEKSVHSNYQMFTKNGNIFILDGNLNTYGDSFIIDSYNNKEYQTVLGTDGIIYDLKDKINYPDNFENENISQMTNNLNKHENIVEVMYNDGRVYVFNYITGSKIFDSNEKVESLVNNIFTKLRSAPKLYTLNKQDFEEATVLEDKLTETPIEEVEQKILSKIEENSNTEKYNDKNNIETSQNIITNIAENENTIKGNELKKSQNENEPYSGEIKNSSNTKQSYTTVYDSTSNQYLVYKVSDLLSTQNENEKTISETEKISKSPELKEYYDFAKGKQEFGTTSGIYLIIITISIIIIILFTMYRKKNY